MSAVLPTFMHFKMTASNFNIGMTSEKNIFKADLPLYKDVR